MQLVLSSGSTEAKMFRETSIEVERRKWGITEKENDAAGAQLRLSWCKKLVQPMTHTGYWPSSKSITSNYWASSTGPTAVRLVTTPASSTTGCIFTPVCQCTRICPHWPSRTTTGPAEVQLAASSIQCVDVHTGPAAARLLVSLQILCFHGWPPKTGMYIYRLEWFCIKSCHGITQQSFKRSLRFLNAITHIDEYNCM